MAILFAAPEPVVEVFCTKNTLSEGVNFINRVKCSRVNKEKDFIILMKINRLEYC